MPAALNIERSVTGQPWRWRRGTEPGDGMDALVDELLLARGVPREDLPRPSGPRLGLSPDGLEPQLIAQPAQAPAMPGLQAPDPGQQAQ